jgi:RND family efflux transporter MFP subunit
MSLLNRKTVRITLVLGASVAAGLLLASWLLDRPAPGRSALPSAAATAVAASAPASAPAAGVAPAAATPGAAPAAAGKPALTVAVVSPQREVLSSVIAANGSIQAWEEASIGAEGSGWRLADVRVQVGDAVRRGQVLARFDTRVAEADLAQLRAAVAEAEAAAAEAAANAKRARDLQGSGALSAQQVTQYLTAERTAQARLEAQRAAVRAQDLRLAQGQVLAPDDGVISARGAAATVGAVVPPGQELFRLIRQARLEWRAEVAAAELGALQPGQSVRVQPVGGEPVTGKVRRIAPTVDATTRNGLVYVDLPAAPGLRAGGFARGEFETGRSEAPTLPQTAVLLREGFSWVFVVGPDNRVRQAKVTTGRRTGDRIEIKTGLPADARVVLSGAGFLADGDLVRVSASPSATPVAPATPVPGVAAPRQGG